MLNQHTNILGKTLTATGKYSGNIKLYISNYDETIKSESITITSESQADSERKIAKAKQEAEEKAIETYKDDLTKIITNAIDDDYENNYFDISLNDRKQLDNSIKIDVHINIYSLDFEDPEICKAVTNKLVEALSESKVPFQIGNTLVDFRYTNRAITKYKVTFDPEEQDIKYRDGYGVPIDIDKEIEDTSKSSSSQEPQEEIMVWVSGKGKKYHSKSSCSEMKNPYQISLEDAQSGGRTPCSKCY